MSHRVDWAAEDKVSFDELKECFIISSPMLGLASLFMQGCQNVGVMK
jgi:hypothetical protein